LQSPQLRPRDGRDPEWPLNVDPAVPLASIRDVAVEPLAQVRVCVAQRFEASIDRFDLAVDLAQPLSELTLDEGRDGEAPQAARRDMKIAPFVMGGAT
jgi:hypothetical protein